MRPFFQADSCQINEAGISSAGNPLSRAFDAITSDPLHARQMREGYLNGRGPLMGMGMGQMMDPMMSKMGDLDHAWGEVGQFRPPMRMGPVIGAAMSDQLRQHMEGPLRASEPGFFEGGPGMHMQLARGTGPDWAQEFAVPPGVQHFRPPLHMGPRPLGTDWAMEFGAKDMPPAAMEAAFREAQARGPGLNMSGPATSSSAGPVNQMRPVMPIGMGLPMMGGPCMMGAGPLVSPQSVISAPVISSAPAPIANLQADSKEAQMEEAFREAQNEMQQAGDQADLGQAAQMVEMLRNSGNPKFVNSQFVSFIDKVSKGDLQFKENTVIDRDGNQVDWDSLYDTSVASASDAEHRQLEQLWQASKPAEGFVAQSPADFLEKGWEAGQLLSGAGEFADLEHIWSKASREAMEEAYRLAEQEGNADLQNWMGGSFGEQYLDMAHQFGEANQYLREGEGMKFEEDNPFRDVLDPLAEAQRLIREGRDREALLALQVEVQRNPESSEGWRQLGQLYAEMDQDIEAIQCLRKGHEVDPYNLDSLLALGVSCTNEADRMPALRYLRRWIENHEEHQVLVEGLEPPPDFQLKLWCEQVTMLFQRAAASSPLDTDVFVALGVIENINRNFDAAIQALSTACRLRPNDHTVWNKLGATLANSNRSEQAVVAYHQGLQLKPNYARSWSNLAIAHANLGQHSDAARFYLSSLVLNPEARHIWSFLHTAVLNMNLNSGYAFEAAEAIEQQDLSAATKIIDGVLDPQSLPKPKPELPQPPDEILRSIGL